MKWRLFIFYDSLLLSLVYFIDSILLQNPVYMHQGEIAPHWVYGIFLLIAGILSLIPKYPHRRYFIFAWTIIGTIYLALGLSFFPMWTAFISNCAIAAASYFHASR